MIQAAMYFALGLFTAGLLVLLIAPVVWRRSARLARARIEAAGHKVAGSVSKKTDYVIAGAVGRARAKQALAEARERLAQTLAASQAIVYSTEATGDLRLTFLSENTASLLGYDAEELLGIPSPVHLVHPEDLCKIEDRLERRREGATLPCCYETRIVTKNGNVIPVEVTVTVNQKKGNGLSFAILRDIRNKKQFEQGTGADPSGDVGAGKKYRQQKDRIRRKGQHHHYIKGDAYHQRTSCRGKDKTILAGNQFNG